MSTKELKVWSSSHSGPTREMVDVIKLSDHLAAMAEKDAEIERLIRGLVQIQHILKSRHLTEGQMCLSALSEATCTILNDKELIQKAGAKDAQR